MHPSIYEFTDARAWLCRWIAHRRDGATPRFRRELAQALGLDHARFRLLLNGQHDFEPAWVQPLAELAELDAPATEYLGRLIRLQRAAPPEAGAAQRAVWEIYASHRGLEPADLADLLEPEAQQGPTELALLPAPPLLAELPGLALEPAALRSALLLPPPAEDVARALAAWRAGARFGEPDGARFCRLPDPGAWGSLGAQVWRGCLALSRQSLVALPASTREYNAMIWAIDERARVELAELDQRLDRDFRRTARRHAERRADRVWLLLREQHRLSEILQPPDERKRPADPAGAGLLTERQKTAMKAQDLASEPSDPGSEPCLYRFLDFARFAQTWVERRRELGQVCSATYLAGRSGLSRTLANDLCTGAALLQPSHVAGVLRAFGLGTQDIDYLEALAFHAQATDPAEKARRREALVRAATARGVHTPQGELFRFSAHWSPQAIYELASLPAYQHDPGWVARALGGRLDRAAVSDALRTLARLGLVDPATGRPRSAEPLRQAEHEESVRLAGFRMQDSALRMLGEGLEHPTPDRRLRGLCLALPEAAWPELAAALSAHHHAQRLRCEAATARGAPDRVVILSTQLFTLARPPRR